MIKKFLIYLVDRINESIIILNYFMNSSELHFYIFFFFSFCKKLGNFFF